MKIVKGKKENLIDIDKIEQNFRLRGAINPRSETQEAFNIFERLGFTTSISSVVKDLEQNEDIKILSPFSQSQNSGIVTRPTKFGIISTQDLNKIPSNPAIRRIKFVTNFIMSFLLLAIILTFIIIFVI